MDNVFGFRLNIVNAIENGDSEALVRLRSLLKSVCLRRTKDILHLPEPQQLTQFLHLSLVAKKAY